MCNGDYMEKIHKAVFDSGPLIHLHEIHSASLLSLIKKPCTTPEVKKETSPYLSVFPKNVRIIALEKQGKDFAKYLIEQFVLGIGETTAMSLAKQEKISLFFTDDLDARNVAKHFGFEAHGTLAIIMRALKEKIINKKEAEEKVQSLADSSLFITSDLIAWTFQQIRMYK